MARRGAWTPWAQILCAECDYRALKASERSHTYAKHLAALERMDRTEEVPRSDGELLAHCDECRAECWCRDDVALLQKVGFKISDLDWEGPFGWSLHQTGGMCAALVVVTADGHDVVVTAMDGAFMVGKYVSDEESTWDNPLRMWESAPLHLDDELKPDAMLDALVDECARMTLDFVRGSYVK